MTENRVLVIASGNQGKIHEFQGLLSGLPLEVEPQPEGLDVEETGTTFAANARIKALAVAQSHRTLGPRRRLGPERFSLEWRPRSALGALRTNGS
jgi:hypothetical protein